MNLPQYGEMLTSKEAMKILGCQANWVERLKKRGYLQSVILNGKRYFTAESVYAFKAEKSGEAASAETGTEMVTITEGEKLCGYKPGEYSMTPFRYAAVYRLFKTAVKRGRVWYIARWEVEQFKKRFSIYDGRAIIPAEKAKEMLEIKQYQSLDSYAEQNGIQILKIGTRKFCYRDEVLNHLAELPYMKEADEYFKSRLEVILKEVGDNEDSKTAS